jgi:hypothetical protein
MHHHAEHTIIISSRILHHALKHAAPGEEVHLSMAHRRLTVAGEQFPCIIHPGENATVSTSKAHTICQVLNNIPEQPVAMVLNTLNATVTIKEVLL